MTKTAGRLCVIKKGTTTIGGLKVNSIKVSGEPIDVQSKSDLGIATMLADILTNQSLEITGEGVQEDEVLRNLAFGPVAGRFLTDIKYVFGNGDTITGDFVLTSYSENADMNDGETFNVTFVSDGAWSLA